MVVLKITQNGLKNLERDNKANYNSKVTNITEIK